MITVAQDLNELPERFLAELTEAAYGVVLRHQRPENFLSLRLDLWSALASVLHTEAASPVGQEPYVPRRERTVIGLNDLDERTSIDRDLRVERK